LRSWLKTTIECVEILFNDLKRKVLIALSKKNIAKSVEIDCCEFSISRWRALRFDEPFRFKEANLRDSDIGKIST
jgi:hypothetical protein